MTARDVTWTRSTHCGSGGCVEVALVDGVVLVRDSKLGDDSPVQEWTPGEWCDLLAPIKSGSHYRPGFDLVSSGKVGLGLARHRDWLRFDCDEWLAFTVGVKAGEFDLVRLLPEFQTPSGVGERSGVGDALAAAVTGAGGGAVLPVPVAALDLPDGSPAESPTYLSSGICHCGADGDSPCVCNRSLNVPAGRADVEEADRPGLKPPSDTARRAARDAVRAVYLNGITMDSVLVGDVLAECADAAVDAFLEAVIREAAAPLARS
jgi:hypothetical protein